MLKTAPKTQYHKLSQYKIYHFDKLIHEQNKNWLIKNFNEGATDYPLNVSMLMRNIIWQTRERIQNGDREPVRELIRTFWYMYIKPTLSKTDSLSHETEQYNQLIAILAEMVKDFKIMKYKDIGFRDDNRFNRKVGLNANVILFSEKLGHQDFLAQMAKKYKVSILALGGQPSVMNMEYFVNDLKDRGVDIRRSFYLFSVVDYDTSGWIIRDSFVDNLKHYGIKNIKCRDLIHPDMLTKKEIEISRYILLDKKTTSKKNTSWLRAIRKKAYKNQKYLESKYKDGKRKIYGLEAESISSKRLAKQLEILLPPFLGKNERLMKIEMFENLTDTLKELMIYKLTTGG